MHILIEILLSKEGTIMVDFFLGLHPVIQALLVTLFTWGMTAIGAALVFTTKSFNQKLLDGMLGFAGGVMIAASFGHYCRLL